MSIYMQYFDSVNNLEKAFEQSQDASTLLLEYSCLEQQNFIFYFQNLKYVIEANKKIFEKEFKQQLEQLQHNLTILKAQITKYKEQNSIHNKNILQTILNDIYSTQNFLIIILMLQMSKQMQFLNLTKKIIKQLAELPANQVSSMRSRQFVYYILNNKVNKTCNQQLPEFVSLNTGKQLQKDRDKNTTSDIIEIWFGKDFSTLLVQQLRIEGIDDRMIQLITLK